jgi:hypothetical protein
MAWGFNQHLRVFFVSVVEILPSLTRSGSILVHKRDVGLNIPLA